MNDDANWCEKQNTLSEGESTAVLLFRALSRYSSASRKCCGSVKLGRVGGGGLENWGNDHEWILGTLSRIGPRSNK